MLICVETKKDIEILASDLSTESSVLFYFLNETSHHPVATNPIGLFVYLIQTDKTFFISFRHPDALSIPTTSIKLVLDKLFSANVKKYIIEKKNAMYFFDVSDCIDIQFDAYAKTNKQISFENSSRSRLIATPLMLINKKFNDTLKLLKPYFDTECEYSINLANDLCDVFFKIERNGLYVNKSNFNLASHNVINNEGLVFGQYNYFTPTTRPSNRFAKINFAALNKKKKERECFESRFKDEGGMLMVDYESYHLRLFADFIKFKLPASSLHTWLGQYYYDKQELNEEEYNTSKKITFNLIFGGISDDVRKHIPFMDAVATFVEKNWETFLNKGFVTTWKYKRVLSKDCYTDMNPYKLFNYLLQSAETEQNVIGGKKLNEYLKDKKSKLVMYHYDSFLVDMHKSEYKLSPKLVELLTCDNKFPLRIYVGKNYDDLVEVKV
nr:hypothetical protein [uncultured Mediterranean phage uvMED]